MFHVAPAVGLRVYVLAELVVLDCVDMVLDGATEVMGKDRAFEEATAKLASRF